MTATEKYQTILKKAGLYQGAVDNDFGPKTLQASLVYQSQAQNVPIPKWLIWAAAEFGQKEIYSTQNNARIIHYHSFTDLAAQEDEVAWCASFVNAALIEGAHLEGTRSASAASFKEFGRSAWVNKLGAVLLKQTNTGSHRHVFFNVGYLDDTIFGLGGNQSNMVNVLPYPSAVITESRYPA